MYKLIWISLAAAVALMIAIPVAGVVGIIRVEGITPHGWAAYGIAVFGSLLLSGVLYALSFYSSRSGHDELRIENEQQ